MNLQEFISDLDIRDDETQRVSCPLCGGYKTFTVSRKHGKILYNCYKASCGAKGAKVVRRSIASIEAFLNGETPDNSHQNTPLRLPDTVFPCFDRQVCRDYIDQLNIQYAIDQGYAHVMYDIAENRCVFVIYDDNKEILGAVGRALTKGVLPKWKRYDRRKDLMFVCGDKKGTAVLVEDCASACTVFASGYTGVALLGTSLSDHHITQLRVFDKVIVALDADASQKAIKLQKRLDDYVPTELLFLTDDLKYFTPDIVRSLLTK